MSVLPTTRPSTVTSEPLAWRGKRSCARPVTTPGYTKPVRAHSTTVSNSAGLTWWRSMAIASDESKDDEKQVEQLDAHEGHDQAAEPVDEQVAAQHGRGGSRTVGDAAERQRDERDDDERVEDHARQNRRLRRVQSHHVQRPELRIGGDEQRGDDGEILGHVVGDGERRE